MPEPEKSKAQGWRHSAGKVWEITLPSGNRIKIRRPSFFSMVRRGIIPARLFNTMMGLSSNGKAQGLGQSVQEGEQASKDLLQTINAYVMEASVEPKIVEANPKEGEVAIDDVPDEDLMEIFSSAQKALSAGREGEGQALATFSERPGGATP